MAYSDYGAFVYLNGERRTDKEDVGVYDTDEGSLPTGLRDSRAQEVPPQRGDAQARGEVQVMATEYVLDADKIAHWRIDNHVPLKQLARAAGVNLSSLSHAISNGREVKMNLLLNLAEAMGEDPRDIVRKKVER